MRPPFYGPTPLQRKILAYIESVAIEGEAVVNQEEIGAAVNRDRSLISRTLAIMRRRGDIAVTPLSRGTRVMLK